MKNFELQNMEVSSLSLKEMVETNGGFIGLILVGLIQLAGVGLLAVGIYASYEKGYNQALEQE